MAESTGSRERLESAIRRIPKDVIESGAIQVTQPIATYTVSDGTITTRDVFREEMLGDGDASDGKRCAAVESILDLAGKGETQSDGTALLRLNDFHCIEPPVGRGLSYEYPVTVVATPRDGTPVHLAVEAQIVDVQGEADVHITVRSWDTNGAPVSARFDWRCAVPFHPTF